MQCTIKYNTKKENQHNQELNDLVALAYQNATVNDYPQEMIDYQLEQVTSYYKSYADQYGMEYADFLEQQVGMTEEEFVKKMTETVKQSLGQEMVLRAIAETEGVEISDEKFQEKASKYEKVYKKWTKDADKKWDDKKSVDQDLWKEVKFKYKAGWYEKFYQIWNCLF